MTLLGTFANSVRGRSRMAFVGIAMMTISPALAASTTETGAAPISAANAVRLSGPFEFAIETLWPSLIKWRAIALPMFPAPMIPILMRTLPFIVERRGQPLLNVGRAPVPKPREVVGLLERLGVREARQRGSHRQ